MNGSSLLRICCLALGLGALLPLSISCGGDGVSTIGGVRSELVATAGDGVTALAFAPDGRLFLTEQNRGDIRIITAEGQLLPEPFAHVDIVRGLEWGLVGIVLDPDFQENHYVYIYFTRPVDNKPNQTTPTLMRFTDVDNKGIDPTILVEFPQSDPELAPVHVAGGLHFGPDGYLYISIGDMNRPEMAQDLSSPLGKILRITRDGTAAPDNPFVDRPDVDPRIYAYGLRNTFAFTFDPESGRIYGNENGPSNCDELNIVEAGNNYSWPQSATTTGVCQNPDGVEPIYYYAKPGKRPEELSSTVAPTGIQFVSSEVYPALGDGVLVCEFNTLFMRRLQLAGPNKDQVADDRVVVEDCSVALAVDQTGIIYYSTGKQILRLLPQ